MALQEVWQGRRGCLSSTAAKGPGSMGGKKTMKVSVVLKLAQAIVKLWAEGEWFGMCRVVAKTGDEGREWWQHWQCR